MLADSGGGSGNVDFHRLHLEDIAEKLRQAEENPKRFDNDDDDNDDDDCKPVQEFDSFTDATARFQKTFYYGGLDLDDMPSTDRFSLALTQMAVERFTRAEDSKLDKLSVEKAANISKATAACPTSLILALIYLERVRADNPKYLRAVSSTELFLVSLLAASKFLNDDGEDDEVFNDDWAEAAGITPKDLNGKEMDFYSAIDWRLFVSLREFDEKKEEIEHNLAKRRLLRNKKRKHSNNNSNASTATYTDLISLQQTGSNPNNNNNKRFWKELAETFFKVTTVCATAYAAGIVTMVGTVVALNKTPLGPANVFKKQQSAAPTAPDEVILSGAPEGASAASASPTKIDLDILMSRMATANETEESLERDQEQQQQQQQQNNDSWLLDLDSYRTITSVLLSSIAADLDRPPDHHHQLHHEVLGLLDLRPSLLPTWKDTCATSAAAAFGSLQCDVMPIMGH